MFFAGQRESSHREGCRFRHWCRRGAALLERGSGCGPDGPLGGAEEEGENRVRLMEAE
jgi:hypothetical protein